MVSVSLYQKVDRRYRPRSIMSRLSLPAIMAGVALLGLTVLFIERVPISTPGRITATTSYTSSLRVTDENSRQCRFFLAESAIPYGGLGVYTAMDIAKGEPAQAMPDICIYVADTPRNTQFETHSWARDVFLGNFEGWNPRAACEGIATLFNSMPEEKAVATSKLVSMRVPTNGGLDRKKDPGAGAITHYYGVSSEATRNIPAGSELTINYGDWEYDPNREYKAPTRSVDWLRSHGTCIDNIDIRTATDPQMGRGAFASRPLKKGTVVAPAPLQTFRSRGAFAQQSPEALFVNYCFQPKDTDILFYPYGPGVNLINHSSKKANVAVRWSTTLPNHLDWLELASDQFWEMVYPGALIMEVYALREISANEELFMDYGKDWEAAWDKHVREWTPLEGADQYVYPADMDLSQPFRTLDEQKNQPYPSNLVTVCRSGNWALDRPRRDEWKEPEWDWPAGLAYCHILSRQEEAEERYVYEVAMSYEAYRTDYDSAIPIESRYQDYNVPHRAILFLDKPYKSDMHLSNAFRHPIGFPENLIPKK